MSDTPPDGIPCPRCRGTDWKTSETRKRPGRLVRVRTCCKCHLRVRTREVIEGYPGRARPDTQEVAT